MKSAAAGDTVGLDEFSVQLVDEDSDREYGWVMATAWSMVCDFAGSLSRRSPFDRPVWEYLKQQLPPAQAIVLEGLAAGWQGTYEELWYASLEAADLPLTPEPPHKFRERQPPKRIPAVKSVKSHVDLAGALTSRIAPAFEGMLTVDYERDEEGKELVTFTHEDQNAVAVLHQLLPSRALDELDLLVRWFSTGETRLVGTLRRYCEVNAGIKVKKPKGVYSHLPVQPFSDEDPQWPLLNAQLTSRQRKWLEKEGPAWEDGGRKLLPACLASRAR